MSILNPLFGASKPFKDKNLVIITKRLRGNTYLLNTYGTLRRNAVVPLSVFCFKA